MQLDEEGKDLFDFLEKRMFWLRIRWGNYETLYGHTAARIELLNDAASGFFFVVQEVLFDEISMDLCRLTDDTTKQKNATIRMVKKLKAFKGEPKYARVEKLVTEIEKCVEPIHDYRNKVMAHLDLHATLKTHKTKVHAVDPATRAQISTLLDLFGKLLNAISDLLGEAPCYFDNCHIDGDADQLLNLIKGAMHYNDMVNEGVILSESDPRGRYSDI